MEKPGILHSAVLCVSLIGADNKLEQRKRSLVLIDCVYLITTVPSL